MRTAHLFAGAGGGLLADLILGHRPVLAVDFEESCCASLQSRVDEGWLPGLKVFHGDIKKFDFVPWRGRVDCIAAGFPCQDISCAGSGEGLQGARSGLVVEVFRAIDECVPALVFLENSPQIRSRGRADIVRELVARGYSWRDGRITAAGIGAPHKRERWFLLAADIDGKRKLEQERSKFAQWGWASDEASNTAHDYEFRRDGRCGERATVPRGDESANRDAGPPNTMRQRLEGAIQCGGISQADAETIQAAAGYTNAYHWSPPDIGLCGVVHGVAAELDCGTKKARIKACGNGQVPLQAAAAWLALAYGD